MPYELQTGSPVDAWVVLFKGVIADSFTVLGGPTNVFSDRGDAVEAAIAYVNGGGAQAVVLGADQTAVFQNVE